jgi:hypothetical protein
LCLAGDTTTKRCQRQVLGQLGENQLACVHERVPQKNDVAGAQVALVEFKSRPEKQNLYHYFQQVMPLVRLDVRTALIRIIDTRRVRM